MDKERRRRLEALEEREANSQPTPLTTSGWEEISEATQSLKEAYGWSDAQYRRWVNRPKGFAYEVEEIMLIKDMSEAMDSQGNLPEDFGLDERSEYLESLDESGWPEHWKPEEGGRGVW
jgi:hypothetical protein